MPCVGSETQDKVSYQTNGTDNTADTLAKLLLGTHFIMGSTTVVVAVSAAASAGDNDQRGSDGNNHKHQADANITLKNQHRNNAENVQCNGDSPQILAPIAVNLRLHRLIIACRLAIGLGSAVQDLVDVSDAGDG